MSQHADDHSEDGVPQRLMDLRVRLERMATLRRHRCIWLCLGTVLLAGVMWHFWEATAARAKRVWQQVSAGDARERFIADLAADPLVQRELDALGAELLSDFAPRLADDVSGKFAAAGPAFRDALVRSGMRISQRAQKRFDAVLPVAMSSELQAVEDNVRAAFPGFDAAAFELEMQSRGGQLTATLDEAAAGRLALAAIQAFRAKLALQEFAGQHVRLASPVEQAEAELVDALLALLAFELEPTLGRQMMSR